MGVAADVLVNICAYVLVCAQRVGMADCASVHVCVHGEKSAVSH